MIKMQAIGNLGKDAIINQVNGKQVINFSIAHTEKFKGKNGNHQEKTTWIEANYWSDSKVGDYLKKGTQVYIEGQPDVRSYESNGKQGVSLVCRVFSIQLLGSKTNGNEPAPTPESANNKKNLETSDQDLPF